MGLRPRLSAAAASRLYWNPRAGARDPLFENRWAGTNREHHLHDALDRSGSDRRSRADRLPILSAVPRLVRAGRPRSQVGILS